MNKYLLKKDRVSLCHKSNCITAYGKNAEFISVGIFLMFLFIGISTLSKNS